MKTKQKKYNKYNTKKNKKYLKNKVKNTRKKLKIKTRKLRKNANKGGMFRFLTGNKVDTSLPMTSTKTRKQRNLESLFLTDLNDNENYGYNMIFLNTNTNFNLKLTFLNAAPINQRLLTFVNKMNKLVTSSQYEQIQSGSIPSGLNIKKLGGIFNPIDLNDLPDIEELYDIVLKSETYGSGQKIKNSENIGTTTIEKIIRIGVREINSINIYYNNGIIFQPPKPSVPQISEQDYLNKIINLLRILKTTLRTSNLQLFYLISFFPSIDEAILSFFIPFMNKINDVTSTNSRIGYPVVNSLCSEPYQGAYSTESNFLKRIRDYSDQINTFFGLNPPRTQSIIDYILEQNMTQINSTGETLTLTKTSVCFLYLRINPGQHDEIYRLLGLSLNTINANITTGELTLGYKFIWTLNDVDIAYIKNFARSNEIESVFSFLNDVYPLFSSPIKKMAYNLGVPRNMGYGNRPPPSKPLITEPSRELVSPIVSGEEDESGFKTFTDGETPRPSEAASPSDLISEESEKLKVPNIEENPRIQTA